MTPNTPTQRLLDFMEFGIKNRLPKCETAEEFRDAIKYPKDNFHKLKKRQLNLTVTQIEAAAKAYGLNLNWIFGLSNEMFRGSGKLTLMQELQVAVKNLEFELSKVKSKNLSKII